MMDRKTFEEVHAADAPAAGVPVLLEDRRTGLIAHWDDEGAQVEVYVGNDHSCLKVPWKNLIPTILGIVVGLKDAEPL